MSPVGIPRISRRDRPRHKCGRRVDAREAGATQPPAGLFTTTLTQAEVFYGLSLLPEGRRRTGLMQAARPMFETDFAGRILPFDAEAAWAYGEIAAARRASGRPISQIDGQIAAIVRSRGARLATRNTRDFLDCGLTLLDPWTSDGA